MLAFAVYENGQPLERWPAYIKSQAYCCYLADADERPRERAFDHDYARLIGYCLPGEQRRLFIRYPLADVGDPILRTRLLTSGRTLRNLSVELALGRLELLDEALTGALRAGDALSTAVREEIARAGALAAQAQQQDMDGRRAAAAEMADASLALSVPAGERVTREITEQRLHARAQRGDLSGFLLGCPAFGFAEDGDWSPHGKRGQHFLQAFNYATLPFYISGMEPAPGQVLHDDVRQSAEALRARGVRLKGHPLVWTFDLCLPPHYRGADFATCCRLFRERILRDVPPFRPYIDYWDIINEAHDTPWANSLGFTSEQMVELTALAAETTRQVAPESKLVVNVCLPFGEYAAGAPGRVTTLEYVRACIDAGIDFDIIGIQFYYGSGLLQYCWDMLEISRILDRFLALGKEVHITELGTPSAMGVDPNAMIKEGNDVGVWHGAWTPATQAEWVEHFYRMCAAKPGINAITWWGLSDATPVFWPYSGLLDAHDDPKPAFAHLRELRRLIDAAAAPTA